MTGFNLSLKNTTSFLPTPLNHLPSIQSKSDKSFASKKPYKTLARSHGETTVLNTSHLTGDLCAVRAKTLSGNTTERS